MAKLSSREHMARNTYYLSLYRKSLPTPALGVCDLLEAKAHGHGVGMRVK